MSAKVNNHQRNKKYHYNNKTNRNSWYKNPQALLVLGFIIVITLLIYTPALNNEFTNWDDNEYVTENILIKRLTSENIKEILATPVVTNYHPLTMITLALNYHFSKLNPFSYFLVNILLHILNAVLLFIFIYRLTNNNVWFSTIVSLFFAIHPMHVESVAWISERKDVLYSFFFIWGLITYLKYLQHNHSPFYYIVTLILFVLALLAKPSAVMFPIVLLLIDFLLKRSITLKNSFEKIPFFIGSFIIGLVTIAAQKDSAIGDFNSYSILQKIMFASYGFVIYIVKFIVPFKLSAFHPYPVFDKSLNLPFIYFISPFIVAVVFFGVIKSLKYTRALFFGLLFYFVNIVLTLQFFQVGGAIIAERYTYISYIGLLFIVGKGYLYVLDNLNTNWGKLLYKAFPYIAVIYILFFSYQTVQRCKVWKNTETLWTDVIKKYPNAHGGYNNRGNFYLEKKEFDKALADFSKAIELRPNYDSPYNNRGNVYRQTNRFREAINEYNIAIKLNPKYDIAYSGRGNAYFNLAIYDSALNDYNQALQLNPRYDKGYGNRGALFVQLKEYDKAISDLSTAIQLNPDYADAYLNRGVAYSLTQQWENAINDYTLALQFYPEHALAYLWRGIAFAQLKNYDSAIDNFSKAINISPNNPNFYLERAKIYKRIGNHIAANCDLNKLKQLGLSINEDDLLK